MKKLRICIFILVGILLLGLIGYHIPQKKQISMWVCSLSGEPVWVEMDLKYYRKLFFAPTVKGTMTFDGEEYLDQESTLKTFPGQKDNNSDREWAWRKEARDFPDNMIFCKKPLEGSTLTVWYEISLNRIQFFDHSDIVNSFEKIHFAYTDISMQDEDGSIHGVSYFGPAQTAEEAQQIAAYLGYKTETDWPDIQ